MREFRISPDQGICPEGHPCRLALHTGDADPSSPMAVTLRACDTPHGWSSVAYMGTALVDVYVGPSSVEEYHEATAALAAMIDNHERTGGVDPTHRCPGVEVCAATEAFALRALQAVLDPLPRDPVMPCCGRRESALHTADCPSALAQDEEDNR